MFVSDSYSIHIWTHKIHLPGSYPIALRVLYGPQIKIQAHTIEVKDAECAHYFIELHLFKLKLYTLEIEHTLIHYNIF